MGLGQQPLKLLADSSPVYHSNTSLPRQHAAISWRQISGLGFRNILFICLHLSSTASWEPSFLLSHPCAQISFMPFTELTEREREIWGNNLVFLETLSLILTCVSRSPKAYVKFKNMARQGHYIALIDLVFLKELRLPKVKSDRAQLWWLPTSMTLGLETFIVTLRWGIHLPLTID